MGIMYDTRRAGQATRSCLPWISSCACTALHHIFDCVVEDVIWHTACILFMVSVAVVGAVAFHVPALAEHFVNEVHEVLVVEGIDLVKLIENMETEGSTPKESVVIADCGELVAEEEKSSKE